jgi:hypothetical protein
MSFFIFQIVFVPFQIGFRMFQIGLDAFRIVFSLKLSEPGGSQGSVRQRILKDSKAPQATAAT